MNFWIIAIVLLAVSAALVCWPLLAGAAREKITGLFVLLMLPLVSILMYQYIGTPEAINLPSRPASQQTAQAATAHSQQQGQMDELIAALKQRMSENPDDPEGWLILGRSLKTLQRYDEALTALSNANRLVPGNPSIMVELAETMLFTSGQREVSDEVTQLLESALAIDPNQQKGLWILGMASAQAGDDAKAIGYWQQLLAILDPASGPFEAVTQQIEMAHTRMGMPVDTQTAAVEPTGGAPAAATPAITPSNDTAAPAAGFGIPVTVSIGDGIEGAFPPSAALFIFVHPAGGAGMPLAVKRLAPGGFPLSMNFTDADLLRPGGSLQDFEQLDISARISMAGVANGASGDIQANRVTVATNNVTTIALHLDQRVP